MQALRDMTDIDHQLTQDEAVTLVHRICDANDLYGSDLTFHAIGRVGRVFQKSSPSIRAFGCIPEAVGFTALMMGGLTLLSGQMTMGSFVVYGGLFTGATAVRVWGVVAAAGHVGSVAMEKQLTDELAELNWTDRAVRMAELGMVTKESLPRFIFWAHLADTSQATDWHTALCIPLEMFGDMEPATEDNNGLVARLDEIIGPQHYKDRAAYELLCEMGAQVRTYGHRAEKGVGESVLDELAPAIMCGERLALCATVTLGIGYLLTSITPFGKFFHVLAAGSMVSWAGFKVINMTQRYLSRKAEADMDRYVGQARGQLDTARRNALCGRIDIDDIPASVYGVAQTPGQQFFSWQ